MPKKSDQNRQELKEKIIIAARSTIADQGLQGFNIRKIAKEVGCALGMPYKIFKDSDDIIIHVNARTLNELYDALKKITEKNEPNEKIIYQLAHSYVQYHKENPHFWSALFEYRYDKNFKVPALYEEKINALFSLIEALFQTTKMIHTQDIHKTAVTLWAGLHGICSLSLNGSLSRININSEKDLIDTLVSNCLLGAK